MEHKRCIIHVPNKLDLNRASGSQIRPYKMKEAFETLGYEVDFIEGYGSERKKSIKEIKKRISQGVKYDFLYSESSTMPTLLTEKNHLPLYPDLDFGFFSFCKKRSIPIGLFYRDFHWKFPFYSEGVKGIKKIAALMAYRYDLIRYEHLLDRFFLPTEEAAKYFKGTKLEKITDSLLPGSEVYYEEIEFKHKYYTEKLKDKNGSLKIFYVGGLGGPYQIEELVSGISKVHNVELTICCRQKEWESNTDTLGKYISDKIHVVHEKGEGLIKFFRECDICLACFKHNDYPDIAMPVKVFEYLSYTIPIIATSNTAVGRFVSENEIGWAVDYNEDSVAILIKEICEDYTDIVQKHENARNVLLNNTWKSRAEKVIRELANTKVKKQH